jgi:hypothetical protein
MIWRLDKVQSSQPKRILAQERLPLISPILPAEKIAR